jgi:predicted secreted protein
MLNRVVMIAAAALLLLTGAARAQVLHVDSAPTPQPVLTVQASANGSVPNDRMHAWLRAEADAADAAQAGNEVNARMARALARAKAARGVDASTSAYSTYQVESKDRGGRWRVSQTLSLEASDFLALSALVSRLQAEDGLLVSGLSFSVSPAAQRTAEDALIEQAARAWQQRAQLAAQAFGGANWRAGHVAIQTSDPGRPQPMMRMQATAAAAPVNVEAGKTELSVSISGEVILETVRALPR